MNAAFAQAGTDDYIIKPFSKEEALARVQTHVNLHRLTSELRTKNTALQNEIERREAAETAKTQVEEALKTEAERVSFISEQEASRWGISGFIGQSETFHHEHEEIDRLLEDVTDTDDLDRARRRLLTAVLLAREHFDKEERLVFPLAEKHLTDKTLAELGLKWQQEHKAIVPVKEV